MTSFSTSRPSLPINIMYVSNQLDFSGGASRSLIDILENLNRRRYNPFFASIHEGEVAKRVIALGIPFFKLPSSKVTPPIFALSSIIPFVRILRKHKIDLLHNNQCVDTLYSWIPAKMSGTPIVIHHRDPSIYKRDQFLIRTVAANIANSNWQNKKNLSNRGIVIHEGVDLNKNSSSTDIDFSFENAKGKVIVGLLGRIIPHKAQDIFVKAAGMVLEKTNKVLFVIIGDDKETQSMPYIESVKKMINDLKIQNYVRFTGYMEDGWRLLPLLDISVVPSRKEAFGRVTIESMAYAKPVIATNVWGSLDIVTPETGILVPPDDPQALAEAILSLLPVPEKRLQMGKAGRKRVEEFFTIDAMMTKIYNVYDEVLARR